MLYARGEADAAACGDDFLLCGLADGWRCLVLLDDRVRVRARGGAELGARLPAVVDALAGLRRQLTGPTVLDGILVLPSDAEVAAPTLADVRALEVLDVLCLDGRDVTGEPLRVRQGLLRRLRWPDAGALRLAAASRGDLAAALDQLGHPGATGHGALLARRAGSPYRPGTRSGDWLSFAEREVAEVLLCGVAASGALVLGMPTPHGLVFGGVTWPTRRWRELAGRCTEASAPYPEPPMWPSLGAVAWARPELWLAVEPEVRPGSGRGGPRWRFLRVQEDLSPLAPALDVAPSTEGGA